MSGRCRKTMERSGARSGGSRSGNGAGSGGYRIRLERGAAFSPAPLRSHALVGISLALGLLNVNFKCTRAKERSYFTIISAVLPIPGHLIVPDCFCPGRGTHTRHSGTVPGIPGQLVTLSTFGFAFVFVFFVLIMCSVFVGLYNCLVCVSGVTKGGGCSREGGPPRVTPSRG